MPTPTGIWSQDEADTGHVFDYNLAMWFADHLFTEEVPLFDMGCGPATYLKYFHDRRFKDLTGVEGTSLRQSQFGNVVIQDLTQPFDLKKRGNVMCIEVAEHIPEAYTKVFLDNLVRHMDNIVVNARYMVLSWGIPGQAGLGHVNCKHNIWVIDHMESNYNLHLNTELSLEARAMVSDHAHWLRDTLMIFQYYPS